MKGRKGKNLLFLKKKKQKDFRYAGFEARGGSGLHTNRTKVFCFFSSEKKSLPSSVHA